MPDIDGALALARKMGIDRLDAQILLLHVIGSQPAELPERRAWLMAHGDERLDRAAFEGFKALLQRRLTGEPCAYLTGHQEFFGLDLLVDARVLVPRPDTEILVGWALELLSGPLAARHAAPLLALDLGTGSGAIALALQHSLADLQVDAVDASPGALAVARTNAERLRLPINVLPGDWLQAVRRQYHCIVSNPPYVAENDRHLPALAHEPASALVSGPDGLRDIRHLVAAARSNLMPGGWLLVEHGFDQASEVRKLFEAAGYVEIETRRDLAGHERCTGGMVVLRPTPPYMI